MLTWLILLVGCGGGTAMEYRVRDGERLVIEDRLQNTVKSIERGMVLEELAQRVVREAVTAGTLGQTEVAWQDQPTSVFVKHSTSGQERSWDSRTQDAPPPELKGVESLLSMVRETSVAAGGEVRIREGTAEGLAATGGDGVSTLEGARYLDIVEAGILTAPRGLRQGTGWQTHLAATTHFDHQDHASEIAVNWIVDRVDGDTVLLGHTLESSGRMTPRAGGYVLASAVGKGTLLFDTKRGVPLEYSEDVTYTMASVDAEVDQKITRRRAYSIDTD